MATELSLTPVAACVYTAWRGTSLTSVKMNQRNKKERKKQERQKRAVKRKATQKETNKVAR